MCPEGHLLLKQAVGSAGSEVHTGTREAKGQAHSACNRTGGDENRAGFLEEVAARFSSHRKTQAKSRGGLPAWAQRRLGGAGGRGIGTRKGGGVGQGKPSLLALWAASPACVSGKEAGRLVPKGRDCRLNASAGCWHQQPQDVITQAARDTHDLVFGSADCGHA